MARRYTFKRKPYKHQVQAVKKLLSTGYGGALLMDPRTGKTGASAAYIDILHQHEGVNRVIIICPVIAIGVWRQELRETLTSKYRLVIMDREGRKNGSMPPYGKDILDIVIINYDAFATPGELRYHMRGPDKGKPVIVDGVHLRSKTKGGRYAMKNMVIKWQPQLILLDESHRIKSPSAKKSTAIHSLGPIADYRVILTGTPVTKSKRLFDVYSQWKFLNPERFLDDFGGHMTFAEFKAEYGRWLNKGTYDQFLGSRNEGQLHELMELDAFRITREECYDLPPSTPQIMPVKLEETRKAYDQMAEDMIARIETGEITEATITLVQQLRLRQMTSGLARTEPSAQYPEGRLAFIGAEKLRAIEDRLEDLLEADEKVVIGAQWKGDIARLEALGKKLKVPTFAIHGGVKDREHIPGQFKAVKGGAIFIGQPAAAGEAIDLSSASILQWYSLPSSWVQFKQFTDRIALSNKATFHEFYLATNTVDFLAYETLLEDGDIGKKMIQSPRRLLELGQSFNQEKMIENAESLFKKQVH